MDRYIRLLKTKNELMEQNEISASSTKSTNDMSDWEYEQTPNGRSFNGVRNGYSNAETADDGENYDGGDENHGSVDGDNNDAWNDNNGGGRSSGGGYARRNGAGGGGRRDDFGGGGRGGGAREGDWKCSDCDNSNFASRTECRNCKNPRPDGGGYLPKSKFGGGEDWKCSSCGNSNFATRRECRSCKAPRENGGGNKPGHGGSREGDWICLECSNSNFATRKECRRCNAQREGAGDGVDEQQKPREFYIPPDPTDNEEELFGSAITSGINFSKYDKIPVKITGRNAPKSISDFEEAGFSALVMENIKKSGYRMATPIQKAAIPAIMAGCDLMGCAQTGSGKTAAYLLPIINGLLSSTVDLTIGRPQAVIVAPTRELAIQIFSEARKFSHGSYLKINIVYGGTSSKHQSESVSKGCHILIATTGRLLDFVDRAYITFEDTRYVVLDEADRMLDMGFKESIERIMKHKTMRPQNERQSLMFSATFPQDIQNLASQYLKDYVFVTVGIVGGACADVNQVIMEVTKFEKRNKLMELLEENADGTIVFVETKRGADFLASVLSETQFPTTSIHGDRLQRQREEALRDLKSGRMKVLVATSVAARGLDIRNVRHVVNYDMPSSLDEYVHRIGRTGRVGNKGRSTTFFNPEKDAPLASGLISILENSGQDVPSFLRGYATGGDTKFNQNNFGGRDMRQNKGHDAQPEPLETEESWD